MSFQSKVIRNMELVAENMHKGKPKLVPSDKDLIETTAKVVIRVVPKNKVIEFNECVNYVYKKTKINDRLIAKALSQAIAKKEFSAVSNKQGVFVRKNDI